jgi:O-antigen ligase
MSTNEGSAKTLLPPGAGQAAADRARLPRDLPDAGPAPAQVGYVLLLAYLVLDYVRPQDTFRVFGVIRPAMIVTALLAAWWLCHPRSWVRGNAQQWWVWAFVGLLAVHTPFAVNNFHAFHAWRAMALLLPFMLVVPICIRSAGRLRGTLAFCMLLVAYQAGFGLLHGGRGTGAQFLDENDLALFLNTYLPFGYFLFLNERRVLPKLFYLAATVLALGGVVATSSRGGFVGLLAVGAVGWLVSRRKALSLLVVALLAAAVMWFATDAYWERMRTSTNTEAGTAKERVESWKSGWNMFVHNPLGVGGNNFQVRFSEYQTAYFQRGMWGRVAHSLWFTLLAELGIPGALVYLMLGFYNIRDCLRIRARGREIGGADGRLLSAVGSAMLASMAGFFASATFLSVLYYPHYWYVTAFVIAATRIAAALPVGEGDHPGGTALLRPTPS